MQFLRKNNKSSFSCKNEKWANTTFNNKDYKEHCKKHRSFLKFMIAFYDVKKIRLRKVKGKYSKKKEKGLEYKNGTYIL